MCHVRSATALVPMCTMKSSNPALTKSAIPPQPLLSERSRLETSEYPGSDIDSVPFVRNVSLRPTRVGNPSDSQTAVSSAWLLVKPWMLMKKYVKSSVKWKDDSAADGTRDLPQSSAGGGVDEEASPVPWRLGVRGAQPEADPRVPRRLVPQPLAFDEESLTRSALITCPSAPLSSTQATRLRSTPAQKMVPTAPRPTAGRRRDPSWTAGKSSVKARPGMVEEIPENPDFSAGRCKLELPSSPSSVSWKNSSSCRIRARKASPRRRRAARDRRPR